jgi:hypothetical protein
MIGLDLRANRKGFAADGDTTRRRPCAAFELVADHSRAAADVALYGCAVARALDRCKDVLDLHVLAIDVVEPPVVGLRHHR